MGGQGGRGWPGREDGRGWGVGGGIGGGGVLAGGRERMGAGTRKLVTAVHDGCFSVAALVVVRGSETLGSG